MVIERGIVLVPNNVEVDPNKNFLRIQGPSGPNTNLLKNALLYFDKIAYVETNLIATPSSDIDFLVNEKIARKVNSPLSGSGDMALLYLQAQVKAFKELNAQEPDTWSIGQIGTELSEQRTQKDEVSKLQLLELKINEMLPTPRQNVSLEDILLFKENRHAEFMDFRHYLDSFLDNIITSNNSIRAESQNIYQLKQSIENLRKIAKESQIMSFKNSVKILSTLAPLGALILRTHIDRAVAEVIDFGIATVPIGEALINMLQSSSCKHISPELKYLFYMHKELH